MFLGAPTVKEVTMSTTREFSLSMQDQPGTLGKICQALADRGVNILAFQSMPCAWKDLPSPG